MEGVTANMYRNIKGFWKRRGYKRLNDTVSRRKRTTGKLGRAASTDPNRPRRRFWKIKIVPKLRLLSPKKLLIRFRDAYVNFMLRLASSSAVAGGGGGFGAMDYGVAGFGVRPMKEYDEKVIVEIYKSIVMAQSQGKLLVRDGPENNPSVVLVPQAK